jgi:REP element-mobilizing transposase RayT
LETVLGKTVGYLVTWTTYGAWLQGDTRGYVKKGEIRDGDEKLLKANIRRLKNEPIRFSAKQKQIVRNAIIQEARNNQQIIYALAVCTNHVHMVIGYDGREIEKHVSHFKNAARIALREDGFDGRVWTRGFDKRYCFDEGELKARVDYVNKHK